MSENVKNQDRGSSENQEKEEKEEEKSGFLSRFKKQERKSQSQLLQQSLNLEPGSLEFIEKKLFLARFIDYFSEETLDFIYREKTMNSYKEQLSNIVDNISQKREEDKLIKQSFENKQILMILDSLKQKAEEMAAEKGIEKSIDKRMRNLSILVSIPMFALIFILAFLPIDYIFLFPLLCVFCMVPTLIRNYLMKKWFSFKEENKMDFYTNNREDIMILKGFVGEVLENIRAQLLDLKVPLELIKFVLHSRDYENLTLINQKSQKGVTQYFLSFEYPEGVEPFPIPDQLASAVPGKEEAKTPGEVEKNFIVLKNVKATNGIIEDFVPTLKDDLADQINDLLNECEFKKTDKDVSTVLPNYSPENAIYCVCGEVAEIEGIQICNWKEDFKFYLFEASECGCGEKVYTLSLMDEEQQVPEELKEIFLD